MEQYLSPVVKLINYFSIIKKTKFHLPRLVLICSLPGVFGLLDGGDFIAEVTEEQVFGLKMKRNLFHRLKSTSLT